MTSPTQRSLRALRDRGFTVAIVEHWNAYARVRVDLFGFADLLAMREGEPLVAVQTTSGANLAARRTKLRALPTVALWLATGNRLCVHGWAKRGARGKRKTWTLREAWITEA